MTTIDDARAAVLYEAMLPPCEACKCVLADDPDRNECACGGSCCTDSEYIDTKIDAEARMCQVIERLIAAVREEVLREQP
jgi:hypothetical protein